MGLVGGIRRGKDGRILGLLAFYALVVAVNPVLHDDLACHLKSPTHCSACTASPTASRVEGVTPVLPAPVEAGQVESTSGVAVPFILVVSLPGRSPPA